MKCRTDLRLLTVLQSANIPLCTKCGSIVKPEVVLYGEELNPKIMRKAIWEMRNADMLIIGGTSLVVYPAAKLIEYFSGDKLVVINKEETHVDSQAGLVIQESIGEVLHAVMA